MSNFSDQYWHKDSSVLRDISHKYFAEDLILLNIVMNFTGQQWFKDYQLVIAYLENVLACVFLSA